MQMHQLVERARRMIQVLRGFEVRKATPVEGIEIAPRGTQDFVPFENGAEWGQDGKHDWMDFRFKVTTPADYKGKVTVSIATGRESPAPRKMPSAATSARIETITMYDRRRFHAKESAGRRSSTSWRGRSITGLSPMFLNAMVS